MGYRADAYREICCSRFRLKGISKLFDAHPDLMFRGLACVPAMDEVRVQERKQKLLSRNLESVFCLSISKSQGEVRKLDSARRYLDLEICPGSKIRGEARNLDSGWPAPVFGNW